MSERYPGGLISRSAPVVVGPTGGEGGSASGIWTLEQAAGYIKQGLWPLPILIKQLYSWGTNSGGRLGLDDTVNRSSPVQIGADTNWAQAATGNTFAIAVKTTGSLWSWGQNGYGQLGQNNLIYRSSPVQIGALTDWSKVAAANNFCLAVKTTGTLWSWGVNNYGQLGQNIAVTTYRSSPVQVGALTDWAQISSGVNFALAIKTNGTLWSWGYNGTGQLGQNTAYNLARSSPVQVGALTDWSTVSSGIISSFAIKTNNTLWSWGSNYFGQLGQNNTITRSSPVQVGALTDWSKVSGGTSFCAAVKTDGTLWTWGTNSSGQLGQNDLIYRSSPVQVGALTTWAQVSALGASCVAIKTDGTLWSWGGNTVGQLGQNDRVARSSPVQVGSLPAWGGVAQGPSSFFTIAIKN